MLYIGACFMFTIFCHSAKRQCVGGMFVFDIMCVFCIMFLSRDGAEVLVVMELRCGGPFAKTFQLPSAPIAPGLRRLRAEAPALSPFILTKNNLKKKT